MKAKPLKRHPSLLPFSREHHHSLLLSWKIRRGISLGISAARIKKYTDWFYETYIRDHFRLEEEFVFPVLEEGNELVKRALSEHRRLERLFNDTADAERSISLLEEELENHIRFEERVLFKEIQKVADQQTLRKIEAAHTDTDFEDNMSDPFWLTEEA